MIALSDASGTILERFRYNAFGKRSVLAANDFSTKTDTAYVWSRAFTGQVLDGETGLMLYRNRYYHPTLGRFISRDPIGYEAEDDSLYRYVGNMPSKFVDSFGLARDSITISIENAIATGNIKWLKFILESGQLSTKQAAMVATAIAALELAERIKKCRQPKCHSCVPPAGTRSVRVDVVPPSKGHWPHTGTHTHHYKMRQSPYPLCICFWHKISVTSGNSPDIGEGPIAPPGGGGKL